MRGSMFFLILINNDLLVKVNCVFHITSVWLGFLSMLILRFKIEQTKTRNATMVTSYTIIKKMI